MTHGAQTWCSDSLEGWDRRGGPRRDAQEGGDICILMADSCYCLAETNTTLYSNYPPVKNKLKKNR